MRLPRGYRRIGPGLFWNEELAKVKARVCRPGLRGRKPWSITIVAESRNDALQKGYAFRNHCLKNGAKPGQPVPPGPFSKMPTLDQYVQRCWPVGHLSPRVERDQRYVIDASLLPRFGTFPLDKITKAQLVDFQTALLAKMKAISVNGHLRVLAKILRHAFDNDVLAKMPQMPKSLRYDAPKLAITDDDLDALLRAFDDPQSKPGSAGDEWGQHLDEAMRWSKPLFVVAVECGLARTDLITLKWSEIDWQRRLILRRRNKTGKLATPYITDRALSALQECKTRPMVSSEFAFTTQSGDLYSTTVIRRYFARAKAIAKITKRCRFHDLRHAWATRLASRGLGVYLLQQAGGWTNVTTAQNYIGSVTPEGLQQLAIASEK